MSPFDLTASGIIRALSSIDDRVRGKAETLASRLSRAGIEARIEAGDDASYTVVASGENLFAREFGGLSRPPDRPLDGAIQNLKSGTAE